MTVFRKGRGEVLTSSRIHVKTGPLAFWTLLNNLETRPVLFLERTLPLSIFSEEGNSGHDLLHSKNKGL